MGVPVLVGWLSDHTAAGLMAATGGFTAVYGSGRPYLSRARELALIAVAFAAVTALGLAVAPFGWPLAVPVVALLAMLATWFCNALQVGPPGGYLFLMACAASASMLKPPFDPWHAGLLVLAGGAFAWCVHMAGALAWPRGPEKAAVAQAARAVLAYLETTGTPLQAAARHEAALALHQAWSALVTYQPVAARPNGRLATLRGLNRHLHLVFARALGSDERASPMLFDDVRRIETQALALPRRRPPDALPIPTGVPVGHPGAWHALKGALIESASRQVIVRVGVAALLAGGLGALFHLERAYWAVAAAMLMLHQGFDWTRTVLRALERLLGTWAGLLIAGAILLWHPQGLWLVATIMLLQFVVEMLVVRHYALAVVFITGAALTLASGGHPVAAPGEYLFARGLDTLVGCAVALLVYRALPVRDDGRGLAPPMARVLHGVAALAPMLAAGSVDDVHARTARRDLQRMTFGLEQAYGSAIGASSRQRAAAEDQWPLVAAIQQLAYRMLAACWQRSHEGVEPTQAFGPADAQAMQHALRDLEQHLGGAPLSAHAEVTVSLFAGELQAVHACMKERPPKGPL